MGEHTIILVQTSQAVSTRTWWEFTTPNAAIAGVISEFEKKLKVLNPTLPNITYDIGDLYKWVDRMAECNALVFDKTLQTYVPFNKEWIKRQVYEHLQRAATRR